MPTFEMWGIPLLTRKPLLTGCDTPAQTDTERERERHTHTHTISDLLSVKSPGLSGRASCSKMQQGSHQDETRLGSLLRLFAFLDHLGSRFVQQFQDRPLAVVLLHHISLAKCSTLHCCTACAKQGVTRQHQSELLRLLWLADRRRDTSSAWRPHLDGWKAFWGSRVTCLLIWPPVPGFQNAHSLFGAQLVLPCKEELLIHLLGKGLRVTAIDSRRICLATW